MLDDILDEGRTMHAIREKLLAKGAKSCRSAVFADKAITKSKPIRADYTGLSVPDRYVSATAWTPAACGVISTPSTPWANSPNSNPPPFYFSGCLF